MVYSPLTSTKPIRLSNLLTFCGPVKNQQKPRCYTFKKSDIGMRLHFSNRQPPEFDSSQGLIGMTCRFNLRLTPDNRPRCLRLMFHGGYVSHLSAPQPMNFGVNLNSFGLWGFWSWQAWDISMLQCCWQLESIMTVGACWNSVECIPKRQGAGAEVRMLT